MKMVLKRDAGYVSALDGTQIIKPYEPTELQKKALDSAVDWLSSVTEAGGAALNISVKESRDGRAYYSHNPAGADSIGMGLSLDTKMAHQFGMKTATQTTVHELGHAIEYRKPGVQKAALAFLEYRLNGEPEVDFKDVPGGQEMAGEKGRKDHFDRHFEATSAYYCGKQYYEKDGSKSPGTEVLSMGLEALFRDPVSFMRDDPEYAQFVVAMLRKA
jgi:hypothetical protein